MLLPEILAHYQELGERTRLRTYPHSRLEYLRTWDLLTRLLPPPPARILDVGGATGVYAGPLAERGHAVHVVDPVPEHVADAAQLPGVTAAVGDARHLAEPDASADAVLLLGPLYHLTDRADRVQAWREAARVVRPGGPVVAATISRYASLFDGIRINTYAEDGFAAVAAHSADTGEHLPAGRPWFTTAYFHHPDEPAAEARDAGLIDARTSLIEGPFWLFGDLGAVLDDPARAAALMAVLRRVETEPSLLGSSSHLLTAASNPG